MEKCHGESPIEDHLNQSQNIPFDRLVLSQSNIRRVKHGVTIEHLANDIERRGLLTGLNVRPVLDEAGEDTGMFEIPPVAAATARWPSW